MTVKILKNLISNDQISKLLGVFDDYKDHYRTNRGCIKLYLPGPDKVFDELTDDILSPIFGSNASYVGMFMDRDKPSAIHTDGTRSPPFVNDSFVATHSVLIPLEINPTEAESFTVFFNQYDITYTDRVAVFRGHKEVEERIKIHARENENAFSMEIADYSELKNYNDQPLKKRYLRYLSEHNPLYLKGLSVQQVIKWELGSGMLSPPNQLHCGANYNNHNVGRKKAILYKIQL